MCVWNKKRKQENKKLTGKNSWTSFPINATLYYFPFDNVIADTRGLFASANYGQE